MRLSVTPMCRENLSALRQMSNKHYQGENSVLSRAPSAPALLLFQQRHPLVDINPFCAPWLDDAESKVRNRQRANWSTAGCCFRFAHTLPLLDVLSPMKGLFLRAKRLVAANFIYGTSFCPNPRSEENIHIWCFLKGKWTSLMFCSHEIIYAKSVSNSQDVQFPSYQSHSKLMARAEILRISGTQ
jgi:hypothetical protein